MKVSAAFTYAKGVHGSRFVDRNDAGVRLPLELRPGRETNGIGQLTTLESSAKSLYRGLTLGLQKQMSQHFQFQMNYQLSEDLADDDNERDPFSYRYAVANNFQPDYGFSDRMERHRFNAFGLWQAPWGIEILTAHQLSFAAARLGGKPAAGQRLHRQAQYAMEGQHAFSRSIFAPPRTSSSASGSRLQAIVDAFNLTNSSQSQAPRNHEACCSISMARCRAAWAIRGRPNSACAFSSRRFAREGCDHSKFKLMMQSSPDFTFTLTCKFFCLAS